MDKSGGHLSDALNCAVRLRRCAMVCAVLPLAFSSAPALAQNDNIYVPPEGCTGTVTIQTRDCQVDNIWTCEAYPGHSWRMEFKADGPTFMSRIDAETQWIESYYLFPAQRRELIQPSDDPASLSELLETGIDAYDFAMRAPGGPTRIVGFDRLTGEEVVIDGEPLLVTEFNARHETPDGTVTQIKGNEYVSLRHRRFIAGTYEVTRNGTSFETDQSPVDFIYPGEPGFFTKTPLYDCDASLARFVPTVKGYDQ